MINNESVAEVVEESEPLGQTITAISPPDDGFDTYTAYKGNVGEPEWQCQAPEGFYGSFSSLPWHCQREAMRNDPIPYEPAKESPNNIPHPQRPQTEPPTSQNGLNRLMKYTNFSTSKPMNDNEGGRPGGRDDGCTWNDGRPECAVQSEGYREDPIELKKAEYGDDDESWVKVVSKNPYDWIPSFSPEARKKFEDCISIPTAIYLQKVENINNNAENVWQQQSLSYGIRTFGIPTTASLFTIPSALAQPGASYTYGWTRLTIDGKRVFRRAIPMNRVLLWVSLVGNTGDYLYQRSVVREKDIADFELYTTEYWNARKKCINENPYDTYLPNPQSKINLISPKKNFWDK